MNDPRWWLRRMFGFEGHKWVVYFWFVGWDCFSIGAHVCVGAPNFELHLPFGFVRVGRHTNPKRNIRRTWSFFGIGS